MPEFHPAASVVIATRNRKDDLRRAIVSALAQDVPCEILVLDDASDDDSPAMVRAEFPSVRLVESKSSIGYIAQRNRGAELAQAEYLFSIDDDAEFSTPCVVRQTLADFKHPRIAAVSIPHKDVLISPEFKTPTPPGPGNWVVASYVGTAHAVRRDLFLRYGGYRAELLHNTEERDFCTRLLNFGHVTLLGSADAILHYASPVRNAWRGLMLARRNDLCNGFWNVPFPHVLYHLPGTILNGLRFAVVRQCLPQTLTGYFRAIPSIWRTRSMRCPVSSSTYLLIRQLNSEKVLPFDEVCRELGPIGQWQTPKQSRQHDQKKNTATKGLKS